MRDIWDEATGLSLLNNDETGAFPSSEFKPNKEYHLSIEEIGIARTYTVRRDGALVGYCVFLVMPHVLYPERVSAHQHFLFIRKDCRGVTAVKFLKWVDEELEKIGAHIVCRVVSKNSKAVDYSRTLERMGYTDIEHNYMKVLNGGQPWPLQVQP